MLLRGFTAALPQKRLPAAFLPNFLFAKSSRAHACLHASTHYAHARPSAKSPSSRDLAQTFSLPPPPEFALAHYARAYYAIPTRRRQRFLIIFSHSLSRVYASAFALICVLFYYNLCLLVLCTFILYVIFLLLFSIFSSFYAPFSCGRRRIFSAYNIQIFAVPTLFIIFPRRPFGQARRRSILLFRITWATLCLFAFFRRFRMRLGSYGSGYRSQHVFYILGKRKRLFCVFGNGARVLCIYANENRVFIFIRHRFERETNYRRRIVSHAKLQKQ